MASQVQICNLALKKLGENAIISIDDETEEAEALRLIYSLVLENELRIHNWNFSIKRTTLAALADAPAFGYTKQYALPSDYLRAIQVGEHFVSDNLRDYVTDTSPFYTVEGNRILTDESAPLKFRYVRKGINESEFDSSFVMAFANRLAYEMAEDSTQSNSKRELAARAYQDSLISAVDSGAVEIPAKRVQDDSWTLARLY